MHSGHYYLFSSLGSQEYLADTKENPILPVLIVPMLIMTLKIDFRDIRVLTTITYYYLLHVEHEYIIFYLNVTLLVWPF